MVFRRPLKSVLSGYKKKGSFDTDTLSKASRNTFAQKYRKLFPEQFLLDDELSPSQQKYKPNDVQIIPKDLVYVCNGKHKGTFAKVMAYVQNNDLFMLEGLTKPSPLHKLQWVQGQTSFIGEVPDLLARKDIRLAAKDLDEEGNVVFLVAEEIVMKGKYFDEKWARWMPRRFVKHNEKYEIPWPEPEESEPDQFLTDQEVVHERTYELQSIGRPPVPEGVISELRNPYSKYKRRYLLEFQARVMTAPKMPLTASQKVFLAKQAEVKPKKYQPLTEEMKELIGQKMADHLNGIENELLKAHLDDLLLIQVPDFAVTQLKIESL